MSTLKRLIQGQDIAFDTHQAGDSQEINWRDLHLEKRLHAGGGKARYPFYDHAKPSSSTRMSEDTLRKVTNEISRELRKNPELTKQLAEAVVNSLQRFSNASATSEDGKIVAKCIAEYFGLGKDFLKVVEDFSGDKLVSLKTIHLESEHRILHEIYQSSTTIEIRKARRNYPLNNIHPDKR